MKKSEFIHLLDAPEKVNNHDISGLQEVVHEFPYFQSAQLLLTKAFHQAENLNFEKQLKKAAAFASDRKRLHSLLFDEKTISPEADKAPDHSDFEATPVEDDSATVVETISEIPQSQLEDPLKEKSAEDENDRQLQRQILTEAINSSILLEVDQEIPEMHTWGKNKFSDATEAEEIDENEAEAQKIDFDENQGHSFSDWIHFYGDVAHTKKSNLLWENTSEESKEAIETFSKKSNLPVRSEFYSAAKMAKLSVQEDDDLVTETLATIYADQGQLEKAIKAFKKLQLKNPEKSVYFAGRIKEIENQLNS